MGSAEAKLAFQKYDEMMGFLDEYCEDVYSGWTSWVDSDCHFNLDQPLLLRNGENILSVNFNKQVRLGSLDLCSEFCAANYALIMYCISCAKLSMIRKHC